MMCGMEPGALDAADGVTDGVPGAGSQRALRLANKRRLLEALHAAGPMTQAGLSRLTGLSTATVSNLVRVLTTEGVVRTSPTTSSGRRALQVQLVAAGTSAAVAGIDIGRRHIRIILTDLSREVITEGSRSLPAGLKAINYIHEADGLLRELCDRAGLGRADLLGCGVGIAGPIDARTGEIAHGAILPEWVGFNLRDHLHERLGIPTFVDNDANLGALAEMTWGPHGEVEQLVFVKLATGIGAGIVLDGVVYRGHIGITGEIGHTIVADYGPVCRCGNRGCLESVASVEVMLRQLTQAEEGERFREPSDIIRAIEAGDPAAWRVLEDAGLSLGRVLGSMANVLNPEAIVIGGPLVPLGDTLLGFIRRGFERLAAPVVSASTQLTTTTLGDRAEALGACSLALRSVPAAKWIGERSVG